MPQGRSQTVSGNIKILERAAHENAGSVNRLFEGSFSINQQYSQSLPAKETSALQTCQAGANDDYIKCFHGRLLSLCGKTASPMFTVESKFSYAADCSRGRL
jgi:hypothetical protein